jgi:hypothetical protein
MTARRATATAWFFIEASVRAKGRNGRISNFVYDISYARSVPILPARRAGLWISGPGFAWVFQERGAVLHKGAGMRGVLH